MPLDNENLLDKTNPDDWFDSIKTMFEDQTIPREWLDYLQKIYAYVEIGNPNSSPTKPPSLIKIQKSGWMLYDYGSYLAVGAGDYAHGPRESDRTDKSPTPGYGTIVAQSWNSAEAIVQFAQKRWPQGAKLLGGTPFMQFAMGYWVYFAQYKVEGLVIHKSDELAYQQISILLGQQATLKSDQKPV